jgi:hypothetical protein
VPAADNARWQQPFATGGAMTFPGRFVSLALALVASAAPVQPLHGRIVKVSK